MRHNFENDGRSEDKPRSISMENDVSSGDTGSARWDNNESNAVE